MPKDTETVDDDHRAIEHHVYVSLREHFTAILTEHDKRWNQEIKAIRSAVDKAETAQDARLELLNEFRAQSSDRDRAFATKEMVERTFRERDNRLTKAETAIARLYGGIAVVAFIGVANLLRIWFGT